MDEEEYSLFFCPCHFAVLVKQINYLHAQIAHLLVTYWLLGYEAACMK